MLQPNWPHSNINSHTNGWPQACYFQLGLSELEIIRPQADAATELAAF